MDFHFLIAAELLCIIPILIYRFTVRDFQYNEEEMKADKEEMTRLSTDKKKQFVSETVFFFYTVLEGS